MRGFSLPHPCGGVPAAVSRFANGCESKSGPSRELTRTKRCRRRQALREAALGETIVGVWSGAGAATEGGLYTDSQTPRYHAVFLGPYLRTWAYTGSTLREWMPFYSDLCSYRFGTLTICCSYMRTVLGHRIINCGFKKKKKIVWQG